MKRLIILLMLFPALANSDPGSATKYLMNEPVSLLDIGILRMELELQSGPSYFANSYSRGSTHMADTLFASVDYNFSDDHIESLVFIGDDESSAEEIENGCKEVLTSLAGLVRLEYETWFSHLGYVSGNLPKDFMDELKQRFQFRCSGNAISEKKSIAVRSDLMSKRMYVSTSELE